MKVLYIHQYFKTPEEGGSLRSYYLAKGLVKSGIAVTMITAHNQTCCLRKLVDGIEVVYLPVAYRNEMKFSRRGWAFIKFMFLAIFESLKHSKINGCYVMTTPLSTGVIAIFNKYVLGRPYIFEVGDLWPKVPIDMGLIKAKWKQNLLTFFEKVFYRNAKGLVGLSEPITSHLKSIAPTIPAQTIFNMSDCERFVFSKKEDDWVDKYQVQDQFVISYTGTFGMANDLGQIIAFAQEVVGLRIQFLLVGNGAEKGKILELIEKANLKNIHVYDAMNQSQLLEVINVTDAMLVSFAAVDSLYTGSPNKFFDALAAGKLVVSNFGGWLGQFIETEACGIVVNSPASFKQKIEEFVTDKTKLRCYQANARKQAEKRFDLKIQSKKQQEFIRQCFN